MDQLLDYVLSEQGSEFRRIFAAELVEAVDQLGADTTTYVLRNWRALAQQTPLAPVVPPTIVAVPGAGAGGAAHNPGTCVCCVRERAGSVSRWDMHVFDSGGTLPRHTHHEQRRS